MGKRKEGVSRKTLKNLSRLKCFTGLLGSSILLYFLPIAVLPSQLFRLEILKHYPAKQLFSMRFSNRILGVIPLLVCLLSLAILPVKGAPRALRADIGQLRHAQPLEAWTMKTEEKYFHVQVYRSGRRYQSSQASWIAFHKSGGGYIVQKAEEAASLCIENGQLISSTGQYVHLEFGNGYATLKTDDKKQDNDVYYQLNGDYLQVLGASMTYGQGEAVCCVGDDGSVYVQAYGPTPFQCLRVDLRPNPGTSF